MKRVFLCILFFFTQRFCPAFGQSEVSFFILSGQPNADLLARAYFMPVAKSINSNLNRGWLFGGEALTPGRVEVGVTLTTAFVPPDQKSFDVTAIGLEATTQLAAGYGSQTPTALGAHTLGPQLNVTTTLPGSGEEAVIATYPMPEGVGVPLIPLPSLQLNLGLMKGTELRTRLLPSIKFRSDGTNYATAMWGIGVTHRLHQSFVRYLPFSVTAGLTYARQRVQGNFERVGSWHQVLNGQEVVRTEQQKDPSHYDDQKLQLRAESLILECILSKEVRAFTFFSGLRYSIGRTYVETLGIYPQIAVRPTDEDPYYELYFKDVKNPIKVAIPYYPLALQAGVSCRLSAFTLGLSGTYATYTSLSAALSVSF
ncbi:DUF6588 family protein [Catalinimonas alkaloidigena]|uniref:DUF6588 family protein n=1 Tax=Catalinimonas alkaloidigena TaxID=1075417 RepID=UPI00115FA3A5|nr:DUF6588 family protein [Catalinimonas alkaloidigena]